MSCQGESESILEMVIIFIWIVSDQYHGQHQGAQDGMGERILMTIISILNYKLMTSDLTSLFVILNPIRVADLRHTMHLMTVEIWERSSHFVTYNFNNFYYNLCMTLTYNQKLLANCHLVMSLSV